MAVDDDDATDALATSSEPPSLGARHVIEHALLRLDELAELGRIAAGVGMVLPCLIPKCVLHVCARGRRAQAEHPQVRRHRRAVLARYEPPTAIDAPSRDQHPRAPSREHSQPR